MKQLLLVGLGGGVGAMSRYLVSMAFLKWVGSTGFPWATLTVNMVGCFCIGALATYTEFSTWISNDARLLLVTGILGGFTTFSAFGLETYQLLRQEEPFQAGFYVLISLMLGLFMVYAGVKIVRCLCF